MHGTGNHQRIEVHHLILKRGVAFAVTGGSANEGDGGRDGLVVEVLLVVYLHQFDQIVGGYVIELAALLAGSTNVPIPISLRIPGWWAAAARNVCVNTP